MVWCDLCCCTQLVEQGFYFLSASSDLLMSHVCGSCNLQLYVGLIFLMFRYIHMSTSSQISKRYFYFQIFMYPIVNL